MMKKLTAILVSICLMICALPALAEGTDLPEGYRRAEAGEDRVVCGNERFELTLFTAEFASWDFMVETLHDPIASNGSTYLLRFDSNGPGLTGDAIIADIAPEMYLRSVSSGEEMAAMRAVPYFDSDTGDPLPTFDLLFYTPNRYEFDDLELLCGGVLYPLADVPRDGLMLTTPTPSPTPTPTPEPTPSPTPVPADIAALNAVYEAAREQKEKSAFDKDVCKGRMIVAIYYSTEGDKPVVFTADSEDTRGFPAEYLASAYETADRAAIIYPTYETVGYYTTGGSAQRVTTWLALVDLHTGKPCGKIKVATDDPPQTITVQVINGIRMPGSGRGDFMIETALEYLAEGCEKAWAKGTPEPYMAPTPEVTPEPTPRLPIDAGDTEAVLKALGDETFSAVYEALKSGEIVKKGTKGDIGRGVQQMLIAFGQKISADGSVGAKTIAALNAVQDTFGLECTDSLDAAGCAELLPRLLILTDPEAAEELLADSMGDDYEYTRACALEAQGKYYSARQAFEASGYPDAEDRAAACVQPWPKTGQLYKNPSVSGSSAKLSVKVNASDEDTAMLVKIYTKDDVLARMLFIGGSGEASTSLPAGIYVIKDGTGKTWYGEEEAFGDEGNYEVMTFDGGEREVELKKNHSSTITINVQKADPNADSVGTRNEKWEDF